MSKTIGQKSPQVACYKCGAEMRRQQVRVTGKHTNKDRAVETEGFICPKCGYVTFHASQIDGFMAAVATVESRLARARARKGCKISVTKCDQRDSRKVRK